MVLRSSWNQRHDPRSVRHTTETRNSGHCQHFDLELRSGILLVRELLLYNGSQASCSVLIFFKFLFRRQTMFSSASRTETVRTLNVLDLCPNTFVSDFNKMVFGILVVGSKFDGAVTTKYQSKILEIGAYVAELEE